MKIILASVLTVSLILLGGCKKKEKLTIDSRAIGPDELEFNVEVERNGDQLVLFINGEESVIDLSDLDSLMLSDDFDGAMIHLTDADDQLMEFVVDIDGAEMMDRMNLHNVLMNVEHDGPEGMHMRRIMVGREHDGTKENREFHARRVKRGTEHNGPQGLRMFREISGGPEHVQIIVERIGPDGTSERHEFTDIDGNEELHEILMDMHLDGDMQRGEWRQGDYSFDTGVHDEHQFIEELDAFRDVARYLDSAETTSMLGIHMIRDELEPENRIDALKTIIDKAPRSSVARNAALIVMIQTYRELENEEDAAKVMVELVLSNSVWDYDEDEDDDD